MGKSDNKSGGSGNPRNPSALRRGVIRQGRGVGENGHADKVGLGRPNRKRHAMDVLDFTHRRRASPDTCDVFVELTAGNVSVVVARATTRIHANIKRYTGRDDFSTSIDDREGRIRPDGAGGIALFASALS